MSALAFIDVVQAGAHCSVQDQGRHGWRHLGVACAGALDPTQAAVANRLVGNPADAAVLEIAISGPVLAFAQPVRIALCGAEFAMRFESAGYVRGWRWPAASTFRRSWAAAVPTCAAVSAVSKAVACARATACRWGRHRYATRNRCAQPHGGSRWAIATKAATSRRFAMCPRLWRGYMRWRTRWMHGLGASAPVATAKACVAKATA
jgi:hypothetical protein